MHPVTDHEVVVEHLLLLMGSAVEEVSSAVAGMLVGVVGLEHSVTKTATLSSSVWCPSLSPMLATARPIVRVAVEPDDPHDLPVRNGL